MDGRRLAAIRIVLLVLGLVIASYLTILHSNGEVGLFCASNSIINCERVLTSPQSIWWRLPVALWGVVWFVLGLLLQFWRAAPAVRTAGAARRLAWVRASWLLGGTAAVLYLIYDEFLVIGRICLWCSSVHLIVFALLVLEAVAPVAS